MKLPSTDALRFVTVVASVASFLFFVGFPVGSFTDPTDATASVRPSSDSAGPSSGSEGVKSPIHRLWQVVQRPANRHCHVRDPNRY